MMDLDRILSEQQECARYLSDPDLCREWAQKYGCTVEHARDGARMGLADWVAEEVLMRLEGAEITEASA